MKSLPYLLLAPLALTPSLLGERPPRSPSGESAEAAKRRARKRNVCPDARLCSTKPLRLLGQPKLVA